MALLMEQYICISQAVDDCLGKNAMYMNKTNAEEENIQMFICYWNFLTKKNLIMDLQLDMADICQKPNGIVYLGKC